MIAVAYGALVLAGALAEWRRQVDYTERFNYHAQQLEGSSELPDPFGLIAHQPEADRARLKRLWAYHRAMRDKYRKALSIPFWYVTEDSPPP